VSHVTSTSLDARVREIVDHHRSWRGPLLPVLHAVQEEYGYVPADVVPVIAHELNLAVAEVHGVVTFYRDFRSAPPGAVQVRVCRAEACQAVGGEELAHAAADRFGVGPGDTSPDGAVSLDDVFCLGNCALGPSVEVCGRVHGRMTVERLGTLVDGALDGATGRWS
jgi:formate dehydrogenase subunit gamma